MDKNNSAIETNPDSMETEEPAKVDDDAISQKSDEILVQGKSNDYFLVFFSTQRVIPKICN